MSMSVARTTVSSVRALHTSSRLLADQSPSSTSTAASLGFSDYSNRTRKLPSIPIAPSSKQNLLRPRTSNPKTGVNADTKNPISPRDGGGQGRDPRSAKRHPGEYGTEQERQRRKRQDRSPVQASLNKARQDRQQSTGDGEGGDEFFVATPSRGRGNAGAGGKGNKMKKVDLDLDSVNVNVNVPSVRARTPRGSSSNDKRTKSAAPRVKEKRVAEVEDRSPAGIFGRMSLLLPVRRGAREAERSVWADGLKPDQARKTEMERLAGSPSIYLPSKPMPTELTGRNAVQSSKILSEWLLSTNPGISMRRAKTGQAVIQSYLK